MASRVLPIEFRGVAKSYGRVAALRPVDLAVAAGEFVTLLGPSGSGKTTLLNVTAGYIVPDRGRVMVGERDVTDLPPRQRNIGMVFQSYALFPHLNVGENVAYGLHVRRIPGPELARRVAAVLDLVQLAGYGDRAIGHLSGGQQQRVALARALVIEPDVLLMDEPLGALDRQLRKHVQLEIRRLHRETGRTTLYVTHDQEEALVMSDRIGVMREGRIEQIGTPRELYERPANAFVASFLGESNLLRGRVVEIRDGWANLDLPDLKVTLRGRAEAGLRAGAEAVALLRPETLSVAADGAGFSARVEEVVFLGEMIAVRSMLPTSQSIWCRRLAGGAWPSERSEIRINWQEDNVRVLPLTSESEEGTP